MYPGRLTGKKQKAFAPHCPPHTKELSSPRSAPLSLVKTGTDTITDVRAKRESVAACSSNTVTRQVARRPPSPGKPTGDAHQEKAPSRAIRHRDRQRHPGVETPRPTAQPSWKQVAQHPPRTGKRSQAAHKEKAPHLATTPVLPSRIGSPRPTALSQLQNKSHDIHHEQL